MRIAAIDYSLRTKSLDIYISGCRPPHCVGCHNPELWDFNIGDEYGDGILEKICDKIDEFPNLIDNIMIFGGEPLDQPIEELEKMLIDISLFWKDIWLFTRYNITEVDERIKTLCNYIKTGRYLSWLKCDDNVQYGIQLATKNQIIYKI